MTHNQTAPQTLIQQAQAGDIRAFHTLFAEFQPQLKSYLYRLVANRNDMEDIAHDVFIIAFENLHTFRGEASLKTWVYTIATNHAKKQLKKRQKWSTDTFDQIRTAASNNPTLMERIYHTNNYAPQGIYEIKEHIDYCFTCVTHMLPIQQQIPLILKDIYGFKIKEICHILDATLSQVKHHLHNGRQKMIDIFDVTCALVNKNGICNQCSQLNGKFNPKQDQQAELMKIKWAKNQANHKHAELYRLRTTLVKEIDPLQGVGTDLHDLLMSIGHQVNNKNQ